MDDGGVVMAFPKDLIEQHYDVCEKFPLECPYNPLGCAEPITRGTRLEHLKVMAHPHSLLLDNIPPDSKVQMQNMVGGCRECKEHLPGASGDGMDVTDPDSKYPVADSDALEETWQGELRQIVKIRVPWSHIYQSSEWVSPEFGGIYGTTWVLKLNITPNAFRCELKLVRGNVHYQPVVEARARGHGTSGTLDWSSNAPMTSGDVITSDGLISLPLTASSRPDYGFLLTLTLQYDRFQTQ
jgi:hypothetical protein